MILHPLVLALCCVLPGDVADGQGVIFGTVVNASAADAPLADVEVVVRVRADGELVPLRETKTDWRGRFVVARLPLGETVEYVAGASRDGVHYPGPKIRLTAKQPQAEVRLSARDSVSAPSPLVLRRMEIAVRPGPGLLTVTETLVVANPSTKCFVGQPLGEGGEPVTLQLAIPAEFERATFQQEFFGRQFAIVGGKLTTGLPWTPGEREVKFTYTLPNRKRHCLWQRPLDLPCDQVRLVVQADYPDEVSCSLGQPSIAKSGEILFESQGPLPAGHALKLELGQLPVPWIVYARWAALAILIGLVAGGSFVLFKRRRTVARQQPADGPTIHVVDAAHSHTRQSPSKKVRSRV